MVTLEELTFAQAVSQEFWYGKICFNCFCQLNHPRRCSRCGQAWYCSEHCQMSDWSSQHKNECRMFRAVSSDAESLDAVLCDRALRGIGRLISRTAVEKNANSNENLYKNWPEDMKVRKISDLCSHLEFTMNDVEVCHDIRPAWDTFQKYFAPNSKLFLSISFSQFSVFAGRWQTNNIAIERARCDSDFSVLGAGIYLQSSRFDHTCGRPDLVRYFKGSRLFLKPTIPSTQITGPYMDSLRINYISNADLTPTINRQQHLMANYLFVCTCEICKDKDADLLKGGALNRTCQKCGNPTVIKVDGELSGQILILENLQDIKSNLAINPSPTAMYFCLKCKEGSEIVATDCLQAIVESFDKVNPEKLSFQSTDEARHSLQSWLGASQYLNTMENALLMFAGMKILEHYRLFVNDRRTEDFVKVATTVTENFERRKFAEALLPISCCRLAKFFQESDTKKAVTFLKKSRRHWSEITRENSDPVLEIDRLLNEITI